MWELELVGHVYTSVVSELGKRAGLRGVLGAPSDDAFGILTDVH